MKTPLACLFFLVCSSILAQPEGIQKIGTLEGITEYKLDNGLRLLLRQDGNQATTTLCIFYRVGSCSESYGQTGNAHLLEHLLFKGTPNRKNIAEELTLHGSLANGITEVEGTYYFETFLPTDENLDWALSMEADRMLNSFISAKDLETEMTVVRNELEIAENSPSSNLRRAVNATVFHWHNYGKTVLGNRYDIEHVDIANLKNFYTTYYQPDNAVLMLVGKIDEGKALAQVKHHFGALPKPARILPKMTTEEPPQRGPREVAVYGQDTQNLLSVVYRSPAATHEDTAAIDLFFETITAAPSGILYKKLVPTGLAIDVETERILGSEPGIFGVQVSVRSSANIEAARKVIIDTLESGEALLTEAELKAAQLRIARDFESLMKGGQVVTVLSKWESRGDWRLIMLYRDRLAGSNLDQVHAVAKKYLQPSNRTVGRFVGDVQDAPVSMPQVQDFKNSLPVFTESTEVLRSETFVATLKSIEERVQRFSIGGIRLSLLPVPREQPSAEISLKLNYGNINSLRGHRVHGMLLNNMFGMGTKQRAWQDLMIALDESRTRLSISGEVGYTEAMVKTQGDVATVIRLIGEIIREPIFEEENFKALKAELVDLLASSKTQPDSIALTELGRLFKPRDPLNPFYEAGYDEEIEHIQNATLAEVKDYYQAFVGASNMEIAIAGDFDPESAKAAVIAAFGDWVSPQPFGELEFEKRILEPTTTTILTPGKANAIFLAQTNFPLWTGQQEYPAILLADFMLGGGWLNSRLANRLRQKEGLSYSIFSVLDVPKKQGVASLTVTAKCAPENMPLLERAFKEEVTRISEDGYTQEELNKARTGLLQERALALTHDRTLVSTLRDLSGKGQTFEEDLILNEKITNLTLEDVNRVVREFLNVNAFTLVKVGDFPSQP